MPRYSVNLSLNFGECLLLMAEINFRAHNFLSYLRVVYRNKYATFKQIRTETITVQASNNRGESKKAKLFITLARSPDFFENMKKFNEIREENEKTANKIQEDSKEQKTN